MIINVDLIYPIGSVYMNFNNVNPSALFGGTWERLGVGRTLISAGGGTSPTGDANTYTGWGNWNGTNNTTWFPSGEKGGCVDHVLTINEMPNHNHAPALDVDGHPFYWGGDNNGLINIQADNFPWTAGYNGSMVRTAYTGGSQAHTNMPPYLAVYMWKRTA